MDAGERVWATSASVLVVPHVLIDPQHPQPPTNTRSPTLNSEEPENPHEWPASNLKTN